MSLFNPVVERLTEINSDLGEDSRRLFHGRGQLYENLKYLSIDWFAPAVLITLFEELSEDRESELVSIVRSCIGSCRAIYLQKRYLPKPQFTLVWGEEVSPLYAKRGDISFHLNLHQQNVGYFLDIEPARVWVQENAADKNVLNLFAFTCSFSVVASRFGAKRVTNMDLSSKSLATGRRNYQLNELSTDGVSFYANDILKSWGRIKRNGPYDLVIVDPPSFQKGSFIASKDYAKILRRLETFASDSAKVLLCLNSPEVLYSEFIFDLKEQMSGFSIEECLEPNRDFPDKEPERALKMVVLSRQSSK